MMNDSWSAGRCAARENRQLIGERPLVGGPRFAAGDVSGEVRIVRKYPRALQPAQHRHHQQITGAERAVEPVGIAEPAGEPIEPDPDAAVKDRPELAILGLVLIEECSHV